MRSKIWRARTFENSWNFANYVRGSWGLFLTQRDECPRLLRLKNYAFWPTVILEEILMFADMGRGFSQYKGGKGARRKFSSQTLKDTCQFFVNHFDPWKIPEFKPLKIPCFESTSHAQKRGKITENKVRESLIINVEGSLGLALRSSVVRVLRIRWKLPSWPLGRAVNGTCTDIAGPANVIGWVPHWGVRCFHFV